MKEFQEQKRAHGSSEQSSRVKMSATAGDGGGEERESGVTRTERSVPTFR